jgi:hypothetical protein
MSAESEEQAGGRQDEAVAGGSGKFCASRPLTTWNPRIINNSE